MKAAEEQLLAGDIVSPEGWSVLGNRYYSATAEVTAPGIRVKTVPPSIAPPYRPLLTDRIGRGRKAESGASCAACMDPEASSEGDRGGNKICNARLNILLGDNGQYVQVFQRPDFHRVDVVFREPSPIMWHVGCAVLNVFA